MSDRDFIEEEKPAPSSSRLSGPLHRLVPSEVFVSLGKVTQRMSTSTSSSSPREKQLELRSSGKGTEQKWGRRGAVMGKVDGCAGSALSNFLSPPGFSGTMGLF